MIVAQPLAEFASLSVPRTEGTLFGLSRWRVQGRENKEIAAELGTLRKTVGLWRQRFAGSRLPGIERDAPRGGRPATRSSGSGGSDYHDDDPRAAASCHPGRLGTLTHDYKRHGTTTLFAALLVAEGLVIEACMSRHRHQKWIKCPKLIEASTYPASICTSWLTITPRTSIPR